MAQNITVLLQSKLYYCFLCFMSWVPSTDLDWNTCFFVDMIVSGPNGEARNRSITITPDNYSSQHCNYFTTGSPGF